MQRLKILFQNTRQEFHRAPLQWVAAAFVIITAITSVGASLMDYKFVSSNPLIKLLQEKVEGNLLLLLMSVILLVWSFLILIKKNKHDTYCRLDESKERILRHVAEQLGKTSLEIAHSLKFGEPLILHHLEELLAYRYVKETHIQGSSWEDIPFRHEWNCDTEGRKYLAHYGLLK